MTHEKFTSARKSLLQRGLRTRTPQSSYNRKINFLGGRQPDRPKAKLYPNMLAQRVHRPHRQPTASMASHNKQFRRHHQGESSQTPTSSTTAAETAKQASITCMREYPLPDGTWVSANIHGIRVIIKKEAKPPCVDEWLEHGATQVMRVFRR